MARDYAKTTNKRAASRGLRSADGGRNWRWPLAGILIALFAVAIFYLKQQSDKIAIEQGDEGGSIIQRTMKQEAPTTTAPHITNVTKKSTAGNISTTASQPTETQASPPPQPKFDFYTMLPKGQTANAPSKTNTSTATTAITPLTTVPATMPKTAPPVTSKQPNTNAAAPTTPAPLSSSTTEIKPASKKQLQQSVQTDTSDLMAVEIQKLGTDKANLTKTETTAYYIVQLGAFKNYNDADQLKAQLVLQGFEVTIKSFKKQSTLYRVYMGPYPSLAAAKKQQHLLEQNQIKSKIAKE